MSAHFCVKRKVGFSAANIPETTHFNYARTNVASFTGIADCGCSPLSAWPTPRPRPGWRAECRSLRFLLDRRHRSVRSSPMTKFGKAASYEGAL